MPCYDNIGGTAREVKKIYDNIGGVLTEVKKGYDNIGGTAREYFTSQEWELWEMHSVLDPALTTVSHNYTTLPNGHPWFRSWVKLTNGQGRSEGGEQRCGMLWRVNPGDVIETNCNYYVSPGFAFVDPLGGTIILGYGAIRGTFLNSGFSALPGAAEAIGPYEQWTNQIITQIAPPNATYFTLAAEAMTFGMDGEFWAEIEVNQVKINGAIKGI